MLDPPPPPKKKNCPATLEPGLTDCGLHLNVETIIIFSCSSAFHYFLAQILKVNGTGKETTLSTKIETDKCILAQCIGLQTLLRSLQFCVCPRRSSSYKSFDISCTANWIKIIIQLLASSR